MGTSPIWLGFAAMWDPAMMAEPITPNPAKTEPVTRERRDRLRWTVTPPRVRMPNVAAIINILS